jgi:hypothetical protein
MKKFFLTIFVLIILAIVGWASYVAYDYIQEKNSLQFALIPAPGAVGTSTDGLPVHASNDIIATSTADTSSWKTYNNDELGYGLKYPGDLIVNEGGSSLILSFPKKTYFHWPLEDDAKITVVASSTCASASFLSDYGKVATSTLTVKDNRFFLSEVTDIGAGNIYNKSIYEIKGNGACYSLVYDSHGTNGSGFYVNDPTLIKKYDDQHSTDSVAVMDKIYGILSTFGIKSTPDGNLER